MLAGSWDDGSRQDDSWDDRCSYVNEKVIHVRDSMVIFDASRVVPLFLASGSHFIDLDDYMSFISSDDYIDGFDDVDALNESELLFNDRVLPRGRAARHGSRRSLAFSIGKQAEQAATNDDIRTLAKLVKRSNFRVSMLRQNAKAERHRKKSNDILQSPSINMYRSEIRKKKQARRTVRRRKAKDAREEDIVQALRERVSDADLSSEQYEHWDELEARDDPDFSLEFEYFLNCTAG